MEKREGGGGPNQNTFFKPPDPGGGGGEGAYIIKAIYDGKCTEVADNHSKLKFTNRTHLFNGTSLYFESYGSFNLVNTNNHVVQVMHY